MQTKGIASSHINSFHKKPAQFVTAPVLSAQGREI
jgi:hypothetical protein